MCTQSACMRKSCVYVCMCVYLYVRMRIRAYVYVSMCIRAYVYLSM